MKKLFLSLLVFAGSGVYVVYQYVGGGSASAATNLPTTSQQTTQTLTSSTPAPSTQSFSPTPTPVSTVTPTPAPTPSPTPAPTPTPTPVAKPTGQYLDGTYTGSGADAYYGTVQVQAVIQGGKLTAVNFLQYPSDRRTSQYINAQAMPQLKSEAISAQSANVSGVSGATDTSQAFIQSLGSALAQAKNS